MSLSSYRKTRGAMYFVHVHLPDGQVMWYSETKEMFGIHPNACFATACNRSDADLNIGKLAIAGVPYVQACVVPCDSALILTPEMRKTLNIA